MESNVLISNPYFMLVDIFIFGCLSIIIFSIFPKRLLNYQKFSLGLGLRANEIFRQFPQLLFFPGFYHMLFLKKLAQNFMLCEEVLKNKFLAVDIHWYYIELIIWCKKVEGYHYAVIKFPFLRVG